MGDVVVADQRYRVLGDIENRCVFEVGLRSGIKVTIQLCEKGICLTAMGIVAAGFGHFIKFNRHQCIAAIVRGYAETGRGYQQQERDGYVYQLSDDYALFPVTHYKGNAFLFIMFKSAYFNGESQEDSTSNGIKKYHYINAPTGLVGIFVSEGSADTLFHVLTDHLGSLTVAIYEETDDVTYYSYDAWGVPRDPESWTSEFEGELFADRGYTGHEHLQAFDLINMNGRVYDPLIARFLSPDPFVQFPGVADGYNRYSYVMNNPLLFTDPSGYMPQWVQDEYDHYYRNGGGGGGGFNYFGWISRSMSYVGWTDNVGPSRADYDYWAANIRGNAAFGEAANSVGKWYQNRRNLKVNWDIALEMGMDFLSTAYQYGGNDVFYTNSSGRSGYLRSKFAVLADYYSDLALLSYMEQIIQSPRNYGMMMGDPEKIPWNRNNNKLMAAHLIEWIRYSEHTGNGVFDIRDAFSGIKPWSDGNSYGISFFALDLEVNGVKLGFQANVFINSAPNGSWNSEVCFGSGESYHSYVGKDGRWWRLNRLDSHKGSSWGTQEMNFQHLYDYLYK